MSLSPTPPPLHCRSCSILTRNLEEIAKKLHREQKSTLHVLVTQRFVGKMRTLVANLPNVTQSLAEISGYVSLFNQGSNGRNQGLVRIKDTFRRCRGLLCSPQLHSGSIRDGSLKNANRSLEVVSYILWQVVYHICIIHTVRKDTGYLDVLHRMNRATVGYDLGRENDLDSSDPSASWT